jgi:hypothetical protein
MKRSSANLIDSTQSMADPDLSSSTESTVGVSSLSLPNLRPIDRNIDSQMAKRAGRMNASAISPEEERALHTERLELLKKQLTTQLTRRELNRLQYVRWSLDRIEDAKSGEAMDVLERRIAQYEQFAEQVKDLQMQLERHRAHGSRGR